jgi:hypothetical protein
VATRRGRPSVDARRGLCAGFRQCGSFVEVWAVDCVSVSLGGYPVDVIGGVESALWEGCYPALTLAPTCGVNQ